MTYAGLRVLLLLAVAIRPAPGQISTAASDVGTTYARARALLDSAITAHGGLEAIRQSRFTVRLEGADVRRNQSVAVGPPYDRETATGVLMVDLPHSRMVYTNAFAYAGGFRNLNRVVIDGPRGFNADLIERTVTHVADRPLWSQRTTLSFVPHLALLAGLGDAASLRWLGDLEIDGERAPSVAVATPQGAQLTLSFHPATKLLRSITTMVTDATAGDAVQEIRFSDYRRAGPWIVPGRRTALTAGEVTSELRYTTFEPLATIPDSLLSAAGLTVPDPEPAPAPIYQLAPDVWAVKGGGYYYALAVAFSDHVLIVEAPGGSADIIRRVRSTVPDKPIRYVALTHHHSDHAGGVREFVAEGATIVTTPGNRALVERIAGATRTIAPDALVRAPRAARVETFTKRRVFTDGRRTVELHDIGPNPHASEMVVAWLPEEGILFQGDLLNLQTDAAIYPNTGTNASMHFAEWIRANRLPVRVLAGVHMLAGPLSQLEEANARWAPPGGRP